MSSLDEWPRHTRERRPWRQSVRGGTREDRMLREVIVSLPPWIAERSVRCSSSLNARIEDSLREVVALDARHGSLLGALRSTLLRTESVASSRIERIEADVADFARALHGNRSNESATSMAAATAALDDLVRSVDGGLDLTTDAVLRAHRALMRDDPIERAHAGEFRGVQNWIGGSDRSPRGALFVPPPPDTVDRYVRDLLSFVNRNDISAMAQAAVAHAQFESIHPFGDGNGRIGRALINTVLRRRGVTATIVVPLASALVARRAAYFELLDRYRRGEVEPIVSAFAASSRMAATESAVTAGRIAGFPEQWRDAVGRVRAGSAASALLDLLPANPVLSAEQAEALVGGATSAVYRGLDRLVEAGILRPLTARKRNQVWGVGDLLDELEDLDRRIGAAARADAAWLP